MPFTASALHALLDAGHDPADVIERAQPAIHRAEAEVDERAEAELYRVVERAWRASQHPDDLDELAAIRELTRTEPGSTVASIAEAALTRRLDAGPLPDSRLDAFRQLVSAGCLLDRVEAWGGIPQKPGTLGAL